jgi:hypothetical protein
LGLCGPGMTESNAGAALALVAKRLPGSGQSCGRGSGDTANARTQLLGGVLVITAPYLLGSLADHLGLHAAFTVEPVLIGACALLLVAGLRLGRHGHHP